MYSYLPNSCEFQKTPMDFLRNGCIQKGRIIIIIIIEVLLMMRAAKPGLNEGDICTSIILYALPAYWLFSV